MSLFSVNITATVFGAWICQSIVGWYFLRPCRASQRNSRNVSRSRRRFCNLSFLSPLAAFPAAVAHRCCSRQLYVYGSLSFVPAEEEWSGTSLFLRAFLSQEGKAAFNVFTDCFTENYRSREPDKALIYSTCKDLIVKYRCYYTEALNKQFECCRCRWGITN